MKFVCLFVVRCRLVYQKFITEKEDVMGDNAINTFLSTANWSHEKTSTLNNEVQIFVAFYSNVITFEVILYDSLHFLSRFGTIKDMNLDLNVS